MGQIKNIKLHIVTDIKRNRLNMHERNIFKQNKPDFEKLGLECQEFAPYVQKGVSGKPYVDFKDPASLRALSTVLLKKYFDISLEIPLDRLIPTIPLRLNYIHWIEDLVEKSLSDEVCGIDIGCGASCVYALLGNRINKWKFIVTEVDEYSEQYARTNIKLNNMEDAITLLKVSATDPLLTTVLKVNDAKYDFCMCNPPFFSEVHQVENRTNHRPLPDSVSTASESESVTHGGEVEFVKKIIDDSLVLKERIKWFTSMLGRKSSMSTIIRYLKSLGIISFITTTFKQGKTMRWGIAWSFTEAVVNKCSIESRKKSKPLFLEPSDKFYIDNNVPMFDRNMSKLTISDMLIKISKVMSIEFEKLGIMIEEPARILLHNMVAYEIIGTAYTNTWTHRRRKRREEKRREENGSTLKVDDYIDKADKPPQVDPHSHTDYGSSIHQDISIGNKRKVDDIDDQEITKRKRLCCESSPEGECSVSLFSFSVTIGQIKQLSVNTSDNIVLSFLCLGEGNRDLFYQMFTYFKNVLQASQLNLRLII